MAGNRIDVTLSVNDDSGSLKKRNQEAKELNQNLTKAAQSAERALRPAAQRAPGGEGTEYGRARGSMGTTGASARDFANQAQGLGGLVRIYATVAANLFAVSAAFNALKDAANTTNMVKGLDQLGAASGMALGSLSKRLVESTDGAITLREAMGTVAKASAAGLNSKQILEIGQIAKTASQALGLDMTDAVSRLTRGITKLEPELLDELGLFTKIGPATEKYALSVGKTAATLTDFERRQAFANAVLEEGRQKFGQLDLAANPYQKLEASVRNLATAGLELLNTFLIPLANVLSSSQGLLLGVLGAISIKLLNMAIPALRGWRNELVEAAQTAKKQAAAINESFGEKFVQRTTAKLQIPQLQKEAAEAERLFKESNRKFLEEDNNYKRKAQSATFKALQSEEGISERIKSIRREITARENEGSEANKRHAAGLQQVVRNYESLLAKRRALNIAENQAEAAFSATNLEEMARLAISKRAGARAERMSILASIGGNVEAGGFKYALETMNAELDKAVDMSRFQKIRTQITGTFTAAAASVGVYLRALAGIGQAIGIVAAGGAILNAIFSKNQDAMQRFNSAVSQNADAVATAARTNKVYENSITTESLVAKGRAFTELGIAVEELTYRFEKSVKDAGVWDNIWNSLLEVVPGISGRSEDFSRAIGTNIAQQLSQIPEGPAKEALKTKLIGIYQSAGLTSEEIAKALQKRSEAEQAKLAKESSDIFRTARDAAKESGERAAGFAEAMKNANTRASELIQTLAINDPIYKFGQSLVDAGAKLQTATGDIEESIASLKEVLKDSKAISLISPESVTILKSYRDQLKNTQVDVAKQNQDLVAAQIKVAELQKDFADIQGPMGQDVAPGERRRVIDQLEEAIKQESKLKAEVLVSEVDIAKIQTAMNKIAVEAISRGYELMGKMQEIALKRGAVEVQKTLLQGLSGLGIERATAASERQDLALQRQEISITEQLVLTMQLNNALQEQRLAQDKIFAIESAIQKEGRQATSAEEERLGQLRPLVIGFEQLAKGKTFSGKEAVGLDPAVQAQNLAILATKQGTAVKQQQLDTKAQIIDLNEILQRKANERSLNKELIDAESRRKDILGQINELLYKNREFLTEEELLSKQLLDTTKQDRDQQSARQAILDQIFAISDRITYSTGEQRLALIENYKTKVQILNAITDQQSAERLLLEIQQEQAKIANKFAKDRAEAAAQNRILDARNQLELESISNALELLSLEAQVNALLPQQIADKEKLLKTDQLFRQSSIDRARVQRQISEEILKIDEEQENTRIAAIKSGTEFSILEFTRRREVAEQVGKIELQRIDETNSARMRAIELQFSLTERQKEYGQIFEKTFQGMADAMLEFVQTGKLNFKSLINSMIQDLIRFELKQQAMMVYQAFRPGLMNLVGSIFNPTGGFGTGYGYGQQDLGLFLAKGGAFESGIMKYAKGGMFTNSVVSEPTLFKFAKGTGLMGEAGPEAIMPLRRDGDGNLGVMATQQGTNVEVVVNNYSSEKAEARETVDSRGNRKIEVIVGEMVAGELGRKNSPVQQSMMTNFMAKPATVRR